MFQVGPNVTNRSEWAGRYDVNFDEVRESMGNPEYHDGFVVGFSITYVPGGYMGPSMSFWLSYDVEITGAQYVLPGIIAMGKAQTTVQFETYREVDTRVQNPSQVEIPVSHERSIVTAAYSSPPGMPIRRDY